MYGTVSIVWVLLIFVLHYGKSKQNACLGLYCSYGYHYSKKIENVLDDKVKFHSEIFQNAEVHRTPFLLNLDAFTVLVRNVGH